MSKFVLFFSVALIALILFAQTSSAQDWAKARLEKSSRHGEWVELKHGERSLKAFVVYPEVKTKAPAVLVIHEIFGLTDWVRGVCDQLAEAGYIAIAPDLLSAPGSDTQTYSDIDAARKAISLLPQPQVTADLNAAADYAAKLPACDGHVSVAGFCWGGGQSFAYANHNSQLKAAYVFYGTGPAAAADATQIHCPVYGFYGEDDARVDMTIPKSEELMKAAGQKFEPVIYRGAGHGFMRAGEAPDATAPNRQARDNAWKRWKSLLAK
jgi:carboxymethylenebutenolidase